MIVIIIFLGNSLVVDVFLLFLKILEFEIVMFYILLSYLDDKSSVIVLDFILFVLFKSFLYLVFFIYLIGFFLENCIVLFL